MRALANISDNGCETAISDFIRVGESQRGHFGMKSANPNYGQLSTSASRSKIGGMRLSELAVSLLICVSVFAQPSPLRGAQSSADNTISEITVDRQGCFGSCPVYTLTLRKGARSEYVGSRTVGNKIFGGSGHYSAEPVSAEAFDQLSKFITDFSFFNLADQYGPAAEDIEKVTVTVKTPMRSKSVTIYDTRNAPFPLWTVLTLADGVAANLHWEDINNARLGFYNSRRTAKC
jgi:Domain of unknown function (DUF6438)